MQHTARQGPASATLFLGQVMEGYPYTIEMYCEDNDKEYKGTPKNHKFPVKFPENSLEEGVMGPRTPKTNGKTEQPIKDYHRELALKDPVQPIFPQKEPVEKIHSLLKRSKTS